MNKVSTEIRFVYVLILGFGWDGSHWRVALGKKKSRTGVKLVTINNTELCSVLPEYNGIIRSNYIKSVKTLVLHEKYLKNCIKVLTERIALIFYVPLKFE